MLGRWLRSKLRPPSQIPDDAWQQALAALPFLAGRPADEIARLRALSARFLQQKEFHGALGFAITDRVALLIAVQAVLPVLHLPGDLDWYDDFVGIVVVPSEVSTRRTLVDEAGVVHEYDEAIIGEARAHGPVMVSWPHVAEGAGGDGQGPILNVVIHEFAHKIDMRDGEVDGCPPLPAHFLGAGSALQARERWLQALEPAYDRFREQAIVAERFGGEPPWLDDYAASSLAEFFAVACEAYFVDRPRFTREFEGLAPAFDAFFRAATDEG